MCLKDDTANRLVVLFFNATFVFFLIDTRRRRTTTTAASSTQQDERLCHELFTMIPKTTQKATKSTP